MTIKKHEKAILLLVLAQTAVFGGFYLKRTGASLNAVAAPKVLKVLSQPLIGNEKELEGSSDAPYTLVEFGDYQCPPCAQQSMKVNALLSDYPDKLRFRFRHYPLEMHDYAKDAALTAEKARASGRFWEVHNRLYGMQTEIAPDQVTKTLGRLHLDTAHLSEKQNQDAEKRVQADMKLAATVGLDSTPTFLLCCPDGRVLKLGDLSQAERLLR